MRIVRRRGPGRRVGSRVVVVAAWLACAPAPPARAQEAAETTLEEARRWLESGLEAAAQERWSEARDAFARAHDLAPRPGLLLNLAAAEVELGELRAALDHYEQVLEGRAEERTEAQEAEARRAVGALRARIPLAVVQLEGGRPGDQVEVDGARVEPGVDVPIDPGEHVATAIRDGAVIARERFSVRENEQHEVRLTVVAPPDVAALDEAPQARARTAQAPVGGEPEPGWLEGAVRSPWAWAALGATLAAVIVVVIVVAAPSTDEPFQGSLDPGVLRVR